MTLVELIRDSTPGSNTLMTIEELTNLGLNVVVFRDNVPVTMVGEDWEYKLEQPSEHYRLIDTKWVRNQQLSGDNVDCAMLRRKDRSHTRWIEERRKTTGTTVEELLKNSSPKLPKLKKSYYRRKLYYENFRPSQIIEAIKGADLAVLPPSLIEKVSAEIPDARLAILEDGVVGGFQLYTAATRENYPRVLVRATTGKYDQKARVDDSTLNLLFREGPKDATHSFSELLRSAFSDPIDSTFYSVLREINSTNPVRRTGVDIQVKLSDFAAHELDNPGSWFEAEEDLGLDQIFERLIYGKPTKFKIVKMPYNNHGLGAKVNGYRIGRNKFIEGFRKGKEERIKKLYQQMWIQPLDSLEEVLDRQANIGRIVDDQDYSGFMKSLEESINAILEPYQHLSAMSRLMGSVLLKSRWGSSIVKQAFYDDFVRISQDFVELYERLAGHLNHLNPNSRELRVLLAPLKYFAGEGGKLNQAYDFLSGVVSRQPKDFGDLSGIFAERLRRNNARLIPELEKYNPLEDKTLETIRIRESGRESILDKLQEAYEKLAEYKPQIETLSPEDNERLSLAVEMAKISGYRLYRAKKRDGQVTYLPARELEGMDVDMLRHIQINISKFKHEALNLDSRRSPQLETLLKQFYSTMPVSEADETIRYLDYVGTRLAAYNAMASFFRKEGWTRPDVVPAEEGVVEIRNGRYPLTRLQHGDSYVRNDTALNPNERIEVLDGTNSGGKTIDVRKAMFIATLALTGCYVPAEYAKISFFDRIRFRLKQTGMHDTSALVSEVQDIGEVIGALGTHIFVGLDETFTSTNDKEGEALTYALIRRLTEDPKARAIITSHYPTLHDMQTDSRFSGVKFSHFSYERQDGKIVFPHKKILGPNLEADYAIPIAENEGLNPKIIAYAKSFVQR